MDGQPDRVGAKDLLVDADVEWRDRELPVELRNHHVGVSERRAQLEIVHLKLGRTSGEVDPQAVHRKGLWDLRSTCPTNGHEQLHGFPNACLVGVEPDGDFLCVRDGRGKQKAESQRDRPEAGGLQ